MHQANQNLIIRIAKGIQQREGLHHRVIFGCRHLFMSPAAGAAGAK